MVAKQQERNSPCSLRSRGCCDFRAIRFHENALFSLKLNEDKLYPSSISHYSCTVFSLLFYRDCPAPNPVLTYWRLRLRLSGRKARWLPSLHLPWVMTHSEQGVAGCAWPQGLFCGCLVDATSLLVIINLLHIPLSNLCFLKSTFRR